MFPTAAHKFNYLNCKINYLVNLSNLDKNNIHCFLYNLFLSK